MEEKVIHMKIKLFASCREQVGESVIDLQLPEPHTLKTLLKCLIEKYPQLQNGINEVSVAVNRVYVEVNIELKETDEIALLPPMSGG
jgi:molybdopterin converting factor subunit 1